MKRFLVAVSCTLLGASGCSDKPTPASPTPPLPATSTATDVLGPRYEATLAEGIDFRKPGYPRGVVDVRGMSGYEPWGRWTNRTETRFTFSEPLPNSFVLEITGGAIGPNVGKPVNVKIGAQIKSFIFSADPFKTQPETQSLDFTSAIPVYTIELQTPQLWRPGSADSRELGIALVALRVIRK
jgi:phosphoglycerol transferase